MAAHNTVFFEKIDRGSQHEAECRTLVEVTAAGAASAQVEDKNLVENVPAQKEQSGQTNLRMRPKRKMSQRYSLKLVPLDHKLQAVHRTRMTN